MLQPLLARFKATAECGGGTSAGSTIASNVLCVACRAMCAMCAVHKGMAIVWYEVEDLSADGADEEVWRQKRGRLLLSV